MDRELMVEFIIGDLQDWLKRDAGLSGSAGVFEDSCEVGTL